MEATPVFQLPPLVQRLDDSSASSSHRYDRFLRVFRDAERFDEEIAFLLAVKRLYDIALALLRSSDKAFIDLVARSIAKPNGDVSKLKQQLFRRVHHGNRWIAILQEAESIAQLESTVSDDEWSFLGLVWTLSHANESVQAH